MNCIVCNNFDFSPPDLQLKIEDGVCSRCLLAKRIRAELRLAEDLRYINAAFNPPRYIWGPIEPTPPPSKSITK